MRGCSPTWTNCDTSWVSKTGLSSDTLSLALREVCRACLARATVPYERLPAAGASGSEVEEASVPEEVLA